MNTQTKISPNRNVARWVGIFFLVAMVASLVGGSFVEGVIGAPDVLTSVAENETALIIGVLLEIINAFAVVGIGVLMFSIFRPSSETGAVGYLAFRVIESVFCSLIVISPLSLIAMARQVAGAGVPDPASFQALSALSAAGRASLVGTLIPVAFSLGALLFYILLYRSRLLPRFIAVWGLIGAALILILNALLTFGASLGMGISMVFALPIITNEIFLGIWLIVKGFNPSTGS